MLKSNSKSSPWELNARRTTPVMILLACALVCVAAWFWQYRLADAQDAAPAAVRSAVRINELMSSNRSAVLDDMGAYSDWIELYNPSEQAVDITGWMLSDGSSLFTFPEQVLEPHQALLVYASGTLRAIPGEDYHAPFRLSASGETVSLTNAFEIAQDTVELPALESNTAWARNGEGMWEATASYTPGLSNDAAYIPAEESALASGLVISEVMAKNVSYAADMDGDFSDYIELYNGSGKDVSLKGCFLSDDEGKRDKWRFPEVTLGAGQYLIVYASGKDLTGSELHTSFGLSADGESVVLSDSRGRLLSKMSYEAAEADVCWSLDATDRWTDALPPTPGFSNDESGAAKMEAALRQSNAGQVFINEIVSSTRVINEATGASHDWIELYNASDRLVDLSGWGLSDNAARPRKWQFPAGTSIGPGQYLVVQLSGQDGVVDGLYHASFSLSNSEGEAVVLCRPDGTIVDRAPAMRQYAGLSYGRAAAQNGFFLFETPTPGAVNSGEPHFGRAQQVAFSQEGGIQGGSFTLTMTAGEGETIYYTTDATEPTPASARYTGPIEISSTTVIRAVACRTGYIDSIPAARTYLFGVSHTLPVVCLTSDPDGMFGEKNGMYVNIDKNWVRPAFIEYYSLDGQGILSQGVDISLHGNDARNYQQKTMNVIARSEYGDNRLRAALFPNRDYTEYQSILLRPSSEDGNYTRMRCSILSTLCADTTVYYQDAAVAILYINGEYWGHYNLRERVNTHSIAQWEGWTEPDLIDLVKSNDDVKQGSNRTFRDLMKWIEKNGVRTQENLDYVNTIVDVENYLDYVMMEMYVANSDLLNVKRYRSVEGDGRWRWAVFDLDWAFHNDSDSYADWLDKSGAGMQNATDNRLFVALMQNDSVKDYFLSTLGERLATCWRSEVIVQRIDQRKALLEPEMPDNYSRWGNSLERWYEKVAEFRAYALSRPAKLIEYIAEYEDLSDAEIEKYFGNALRANPVP